MCLHHSVNTAGYACSQVAVQALIRDRATFSIQVHIPGSLPGRFFPEIQRSALPLRVAVHQEPAAAYVSGIRIDHRQGELDRHSGINGVTAFFQDGEPHLRGLRMGAHHHTVPVFGAAFLTQLAADS